MKPPRQNWRIGCKTAGIGCIDCKQYVIDSMLEELKPIQQRVAEYTGDLAAVDAHYQRGL